MKFFVVTTYADKCTYAYQVETAGQLDAVLREAVKRPAPLVPLSDLDLECDLGAYGKDVTVLVPLDSAAKKEMKRRAL